MDFELILSDVSRWGIT